MMLSQTVLRVAAVGILALAGGLASAATYSFGSLLSGAGAPTPLSFASLTVTEVGQNVNFTLNASGLDLFTGSPFIGAMAVRGTETGSITGVTGGAPVDFGNGKGPGGNNSFDFQFDFGAQGNQLVDNESVSWTWVGGAGDFSNFALHVQGIAYGETKSAWYVPTSPVPEPSTYALMLAGLAVIGAVARRRRQQG